VHGHPRSQNISQQRSTRRHHRTQPIVRDLPAGFTLQQHAAYPCGHAHRERLHRAVERHEGTAELGVGCRGEQGHARNHAGVHGEEQRAGDQQHHVQRHRFDQRDGEHRDDREQHRTLKGFALAQTIR